MIVGKRVPVHYVQMITVVVKSQQSTWEWPNGGDKARSCLWLKLVSFMVVSNGKFMLL